MNRRFQRQQNKIVGDAAPGAFCVAFDAFFFGFGQPNCQRGVTQSLFTHKYHSPFLNSVGSGCRPKLWGPRKVARLFGERSNRPKSDAFAACGKTSRKGELHRADSRTLCLPRTKSGESVKPTLPQTPQIRVVSGASAVYPYSPPKGAQTACKPPTGTKGTLGTNALGVYRFNRHQRHFHHRQKRNIRFLAVGRRCCGGCESGRRNRQSGIPIDSSVV